MGLFRKDDRPIPEGAYRPVPETSGGKLWYVISNHFFRLLGANLICVVFCIPVLTAPSALCALNAVIQQYFRKGYGDVIPTFWEEFRSRLLEKTGWSLLPAAFVLALWWLGSRLGGVFSFVPAAAGLAFSLAVLTWFYEQLALLTLSAGQAFKNALLLTALEAKKDLLILLVCSVTLTLMLVLWPLSFLLLLIVPVLPALLLTAVTLPTLEQRLVQETKEDTESSE